MLTRRARGRAEVARRHGRGAQVAQAIECLIQRLHDAAVLEHIERPARALDGFLLAQHVGPARSDQHEFVEPHGLDRPRSRAHVACMAGIDEDEAGFHDGKTFWSAQCAKPSIVAALPSTLPDPPQPTLQAPPQLTAACTLGARPARHFLRKSGATISKVTPSASTHGSKAAAAMTMPCALPVSAPQACSQVCSHGL